MQLLLHWLKRKFRRAPALPLFYVAVAYKDGNTLWMKTEVLAWAKIISDKFYSDRAVVSVRVWKKQPTDNDMGTLYNKDCVYHLQRTK